ncbi:MAG: fumarylacetoacetate hydrolase family protein [Candidatus Dactylopiibacterium sp.]|nr:fumarylacetoacetate hydrolase family protein [Candidatus Dactylopiibacterium sp.]
MTAVAPRVAVLAGLLCEARRRNCRLPLPGGDWSGFTHEEALAVQQRVAEHFGWFGGGHPPAWKLGGSPHAGAVAAPVPAQAVFAAPWACPAGFAVAHGIEAELAVRLGRDVPAGAGAAEVLQAIDAFFPCIELCDTRILASGPLPAALPLADQQSNRALVLGPPLAPARLPERGALMVRVACGGRIVHAGRGGHPFGDPLASLPWLATHAARTHDGLHAGDIIATGTCSGIHWAGAGEDVEVMFGGLGRVALRTPA